MDTKQPENKNFFSPVNYILILLLAFLFFRAAFEKGINEIPYSQFRQELRAGHIKTVNQKGETLTGVTKDNKPFATNYVTKDLAQDLDKYHVTYSRVPESSATSAFLSFFLPLILFWFVFSWFTRKAMAKTGLGGGLLGAVGKSRAKIYVETDTRTTFKDVAGADEALEELQEVIEFLKNSEKIKRLGGKVPKGILLVGPPGTGKTLIAKAVAGEAGVPFFSTSGAEFVEMFVGVGAARVRDLFEEAKKKAPCIIFIDELDALGKTRHISPMSINDEKEQTLNQLLVEMDGFDTSTGVIILAATNRPEIIDPALLRAGRFDRQVLVDKPDRKGRAEILAIHVRNVKLAKDVVLDKVAALTPGYSGADLANMVNEAALIATRENATEISMKHLTEALERTMAGLQKKGRLLQPFEKKVVAYHEMGHAITTYAFSEEEVVHKVSIIPRGIGSMGYTIQRPTEDRYIMTKAELENKMTSLLGGRAAEYLIFSELSTGAADDLAKATNIARDMVTKFGMSSELGFVSYETQRNMPWNMDGPSAGYSEDVAIKIDDVVKHLVMDAYHRAYRYLNQNINVLHSAADELMKKETLSENDLRDLFQSLPKEPHVPEGFVHKPIEISADEQARRDH
jgi:cell division protease FtsH